MSYDIGLMDPKTGERLCFDEPHQLRGGTFAIGGTVEAWLNVTYNYAKHFKKAFASDDGIRSLYGMPARNSLTVLANAIALLDNDTTDNYWESTEGNARQALINLFNLAVLAPDGVWHGD